MSAADDLRINTLHRFAKHSPRLTLREYSHCEVPAGCGGVVLRWTDPSDGLVAFVRLESPNANVDAWLDGTEILTSTQALGTSAHVLAVHLTRHTLSPTDQLLVVPWVTLEPRSANLLPMDVVARVTSTRQADFARPDLDDRHWPLAERATARDFVGLPTWRRRRIEETLDQGNLVLVTDGEAWVRLRFRLDGASP